MQALQRAPDLTARLLRTFGAPAAQYMEADATALDLSIGMWSLCKSVRLQFAELRALRATCQALALLLRASFRSCQQIMGETPPYDTDEIYYTWPATADMIREVGHPATRVKPDRFRGNV